MPIIVLFLLFLMTDGSEEFFYFSSLRETSSETGFCALPRENLFPAQGNSFSSAGSRFFISSWEFLRDAYRAKSLQASRKA